VLVGLVKPYDGEVIGPFSGADAEVLPSISAILEDIKPLVVWLQ